MLAYRMIASLSLRAVFASLGFMVLLVLVADFVESASRLLDSSSVWNVLLLYTCKVPSISYLALPLAFVVGTCLVFASMGRHGELRALAAAGLGPLDLLKPVIALGIIVAVLVLLLGEVFVPVASDETEQLMEQHFGRIDSSWRFFRNHQWTKGDSGRLIRVGHKSEDGKILDYVIVLNMDDEFHVSRRMDARKLTWKDGKWIAHRVEIRKFGDSGLVSYDKNASLVLDWTESPKRFRDFSGRPQQKSMSQLQNTISLLKKRGIDSAEYSLELHRRFSYPLMGLVLLLFLFPWISDPRNCRSTSAAIVQATMVVFLGYLMMVFCTTAVSGGLFSPWIGAWLPAVLFVVASVPGWHRLLSAKTGPGGSV